MDINRFDHRKKILVWLLIGMSSLLLRLPYLTAPIIDQHAFRQTQTAITVQDWINHGFDLLNYRTPVLGEPWTLPFEFPTYQATAYVLYLLLHPLIGNLDVILRLTSLLWFYLSVFFFVRLAEVLFENVVNGEKYRKFSVLLYLFSPFSLFWSRAVLIEFCAVSFQLGYMYFFLRLLREKQIRTRDVAGAVLFGVFGYLSKSTSMIPAVVFLVIYAVRTYWLDLQNLKGLLVKWKLERLLVQFLAAIIPFMCGIVWIRYSDNVKIRSGYLSLTSSGLRNWNFGGIDVRTNAQSYLKLAKNVEETLPVLLLIIAFIYVCRTRRGDNVFREMLFQIVRKKCHYGTQKYMKLIGS